MISLTYSWHLGEITVTLYLLEGASEIPTIEDISNLDKPKMGVNLNQKKNLEKDEKVEDIYRDGHVA